MAQMISRLTPLVRRGVAGVSCAVLLMGATACSRDAEQPEASPSPSSSVDSARTLEAKPFPLKVRVTQVSGKLNTQQRKSLANKVGTAITSYLDAAWLGDSSRSSVKNAFPSFTDGAARQASANRRLTTNAGLGSSIESITTKEKVAYLGVLAPRRAAAGVTARFRLRFVAEKADASEQRVTVSGRLLLTRKQSGAWKIFGYDVQESVVPSVKGAS